MESIQNTPPFIFLYGVWICIYVGTHVLGVLMLMLRIILYHSSFMFIEAGSLSQIQSLIDNMTILASQLALGTLCFTSKPGITGGFL